MNSMLVRDSTEIQLFEDSQIILLADNDVKLKVLMEKENVQLETLGLYRLKEKKLNVNIEVEHKKPNTHSYIHFRVLMENAADLQFVGKVTGGKNIPNAVSRLENNILVTGNGTKAISKPILEVANDEVAFSHGATLHRLDQAQLFYLTSRGVAEEDVMEMLVESFFDTLLNKVKDEKIRQEIELSLKN